MGWLPINRTPTAMNMPTPSAMYWWSAAGRLDGRRPGAGEAGERVLLVEQMPRLGASNDEAAALALDNVTVMTRTTAFGQYDDNCFALAERVSDHLPTPPEGQPRQRRWVARAERVIFATGAIERPLVFRNNDLPGVMLASAAQGYAKRFGVLPGRAAVVATNNDSAYRAALDLAASGVNLLALVDAREKPPANQRPTYRRLDCRHHRIGDDARHRLERRASG